jgi:hypothetical protein
MQKLHHERKRNGKEASTDANEAASLDNDQVDSDDKALAQATFDMAWDVTQLRQRFEGRIIRRDLRSKGENGEGTLTGMKEYWDVPAYLQLTDDEYAVLRAVDNEVAAYEKTDDTDKDIPSALFQPAVSGSCLQRSFLIYSRGFIYASVKEASMRLPLMLLFITYHPQPFIRTWRILYPEGALRKRRA